MELKFEKFEECGILSAGTNASFGNAKEESAQKKALELCGLEWKNLVLCQQVHGTNVQRVNGSEPKTFAETDGLLTDCAGIVLGVFTADCLPIFLFEPFRKAVGILHSGWRGTAHGIVRKGIEKMKSLFEADSQKMKVYLGPHIHDCCYEVEKEVAALFPEVSRKEKDGRLFLNLEKAVQEQFCSLGVRLENIAGSRSCTACGENFYSYRRNKNPNRMLSFISIR